MPAETYVAEKVVGPGQKLIGCSRCYHMLSSISHVGIVCVHFVIYVTCMFVYV